MHLLPVRTLAILALGTSLASASHEGMATHFLGIGYPYGGCGVSDSIAAWEASVDTLTGQASPFDYVALNVYDTPGNYGSLTHPLTGADTVKMGTYRNGLNCGRWIRFRLGDTCDGLNDGAAGQEFCRNGTGWHPNAYTGSGLHAIVFDQCTDGNAWCRDSRDHVDLHTPILSRLRKDDGTLMPPLARAVLNPDGTPKADANNPWAVFYEVSGFGNPKIVWDFVPAPNYQGEPRFWFSQGSKLWYMRLIVTHLPNGIHGLEQKVGSQWKAAKMDGDAGQQWLLPDPSTTTVTVRLIDADDQPVLGGRTWTLTYPSSCNKDCVSPATPPESVVGTGGTLTGIRNVPLPAQALQVKAGRVELKVPGEGHLELRGLDGSLLGRAGLAQGTASLPVRPGTLVARWKAGNHAGSRILTIP